MHNTSRAPELSATRSRDSCWIIAPVPVLPRRASASASRAAESRRCAPCRLRARRWSRRARRTAWCAATSCGSGGAARARPPRPQRACPSWWRRRCPLGLCVRLIALLLPPSAFRLCFVRFDLSLAQQGLDTRDLAPIRADLGCVVELAGGEVEPSLPQLLLGLREPVRERVVGQFAQL